MEDTGMPYVRPAVLILLVVCAAIIGCAGSSNQTSPSGSPEDTNPPPVQPPVAGGTRLDPQAYGAVSQARLAMATYRLDAEILRMGGTIRIEPRISLKADGIDQEFAPGSLLVVERLWAASEGPIHETTQVTSLQDPPGNTLLEPAPRVYRHDAALDWSGRYPVDLIVQIHDQGDPAGAHPRLFIADIPIVPIANQ